MITLKKFVIESEKFVNSYAASLLTFNIIWFLIPYISDPSYSSQNDLGLP
ncbi:hypothetical protein CN694_25300, partial [Bacillus wiedmannii]